MAIKFIGILSTSIDGDGATASISFDVTGQLVGQLQANVVTIDRHNLPTGVLKSDIDGIAATASLSGPILTVVFSSAPSIGQHFLEVFLLFDTP
jgi:hypothetical protein